MWQQVQPNCALAWGPPGLGPEPRGVTSELAGRPRRHRQRSEQEPRGWDGLLITQSMAFASLARPWGVDLLCGKAGTWAFKHVSVSLPHLVPRVGSAQTRALRDLGSPTSWSPAQRRLCVCWSLPPHTTVWVQARRCRHTFWVPPEKLDLQVPSRGSRVAKPQCCTFAFGGKTRRDGVGSRELSSRRRLASHI